VPLSSALPATEAILLVVRGVANSIHHSHFAQSFGKLDYVFVSARMHQIHHSAELRHRDRNFGGFLSIYDWMFGTLYLPGKDEKFRVGLNENELGERNPHQRLRDCYLEPFGFHGQRLSARKQLTDNAI
jgi:sterol desaturase/sphingolipid hydroxylase (fatty acid hydroxylase superfamily)